MITIERLTDANFRPDSLDHYDRRQQVLRVYRRQGDAYVLVDCPYTEDWSLQRKRAVASSLAGEDCIAYIALQDGEVVGFVGLMKALRGSCMILDLMHVSAALRGRGIGRKLFTLAKQEAKKAGAKALYISACSAEETVAFYRAMGAEITDDPIPEFAESEPFDVQMVCRVDG